MHGAVSEVNLDRDIEQHNYSEHRVATCAVELHGAVGASPSRCWTQQNPGRPRVKLRSANRDPFLCRSGNGLGFPRAGSTARVEHGASASTVKENWQMPRADLAALNIVAP